MLYRTQIYQASDGGAVSKQTVEGDDDDSDSSSDSEDDEECPTLTGEGMEPIREEPKYEKPEPVIDADGFELVQPRRRKR